MLEQLKEQVLQANRDLVHHKLVTLTWGNASGINREEGLIVIKPSGVSFADLELSNLVVVDMAGKVVAGQLRPSSDILTHIELYKAFPGIGGVTHTHSEYASMFAQACMEIPCYGTTHADHFYGPVPVTRFLTEEEVTQAYEKNTGIVIVERFESLDYEQIPGVLVAGHGPFSWGIDAGDGVKNGLILEMAAKIALGSLLLRPGLPPLPDYILKKHYERKHGKDAYYGQNPTCVGEH